MIAIFGHQVMDRRLAGLRCDFVVNVSEGLPAIRHSVGNDLSLLGGGEQGRTSPPMLVCSRSGLLEFCPELLSRVGIDPVLVCGTSNIVMSLDSTNKLIPQR